MNLATPLTEGSRLSVSATGFSATEDLYRAKGLDVSLKRKMLKGAATLTAATALVLGATLPAQAAAYVGDSQLTYHTQDGLQGYITYKTVSGVQGQLAFNSGKTWRYTGSGSTISSPIDQIQAGSGYCVWERVYDGQEPSATRKIGEPTYGKSVSTRWHTLLSAQRMRDANIGAMRYESYLSIYAC